jgi:hypothetical protein
MRLDALQASAALMIQMIVSHAEEARRERPVSASTCGYQGDRKELPEHSWTGG